MAAQFPRHLFRYVSRQRRRLRNAAMPGTRLSRREVRRCGECLRGTQMQAATAALRCGASPVCMEFPHHTKGIGRWNFQKHKSYDRNYGGSSRMLTDNDRLFQVVELR